jgi:hypothetical protein
MFRKSVLELGQPEGAVLFDLTAFTAGPATVLDRIPDGQSGIYAWFRTFHFGSDPDEFADDIIEAIRTPKFQSRTGSLPPYYEINLKSKGHISSSKEASLRKALKDVAFLEAMKFAFQWSILLQAPLYVGKSGNLRSRIEQHLRNGSALRERLSEAGLDLDKSYLLLVPTPAAVEEVLGNEDLNAGIEGEETPAYELLFEEVFSRLFNPAFTVRLG